MTDSCTEIFIIDKSLLNVHIVYCLFFIYIQKSMGLNLKRSFYIKLSYLNVHKLSHLYKGSLINIYFCNSLL